jgi:hypothetical protein
MENRILFWMNYRTYASEVFNGSCAGPTKANQALRSCQPPRCALKRIQMSVKVFVLVKTHIEALSVMSSKPSYAVR